ncbi:hypothetical protein MNEG_13497 [Monoraphidium neglectum]|uniref:Uncharacterized protein n=1 Tax=Monoraphidium neglectum TaxID=145388 RepID=A0A0D2LYD1_9CHLO|nr:hypothetical protein MNEG_13497 [Monoraphidium neglectum]KIY94466.1 hypothetical protein MNEG_13497 [Monoraphidium neglectum]|eukprot:XP_013893486.1 hypothetical protein MNEG_13497 [Monoraphidium neglectum]
MAKDPNFRTQQEKIDAMTMEIKVPVLGSGYIQLPPQKRFEKPLVMQPPTVAVRFRAPPPRRV